MNKTTKFKSEYNTDRTLKIPEGFELITERTSLYNYTTGSNELFYTHTGLDYWTDECTGANFGRPDNYYIKRTGKMRIKYYDNGDIRIPEGYYKLNIGEILQEDDLSGNTFNKFWEKINNPKAVPKGVIPYGRYYGQSYIFIRKINKQVSNRTVQIDGVEIELTKEQEEKINQRTFKKGDLLVVFEDNSLKFSYAGFTGTSSRKNLRKATPEETDLYNKLTKEPKQ